MKKMKWELLLIAVLCLLAAVGCDKDNTLSADGETTATETASETETAAETTAETTAEATETETEKEPRTEPATETETQTEPPHVHEFGDWVTVTEPTCTETGEQTRSCACGETERKTVDARGHNYVENKCERCGETKPASQGLEFTLNDDGNSYSVTGIGSCPDTNIVIPAEHEGKPVTGIGDSAFYGCSALTSITIPDSVTSIVGSAFFDCFGLTSITIPDSVTSIGGAAFYNTAYYNNESNWTDGVLYIGSALIDCKRDKAGAVTIKSGTICIADSAFYDIPNLTSITIPNSVISICSGAFGECTALSIITIPDGVTGIGDYAFWGCYSLSSITFSGTRAQWAAISKGNNWKREAASFTVHCTDGDIDKADA